MKQKFYWTDEKEKELISMWNKYALYKISHYFHTTDETILKKAKELNLNEYKSSRWTKEEEKLLEEYSKKYVAKTIARKLGRSYLSVQKKAIKLGINLRFKRDPWKPWMIDYLKDNINKKSLREIETIIGLNYHKIILKCKELGIVCESDRWTDEEIEILKEYALKCHFKELTKVLPNRSIGAISAKAYELGIETISNYKKLDDDSILYIKENWGKIPATEIARNLKISVGVLYRYKNKLNLPNVGQKKKWTDDVIKKMAKDAKTMTRNDLAKKYKTSIRQISSVASKNDIKLIRSNKIWTEEKDEQLKELVDQKLELKEIAKAMDMSTRQVRMRANILNMNIKKTYDKWTDEEIEVLKILSKEKTSSDIADILKKTERQVSVKAHKLGIFVNRNKKHLWTDEETEKLLEIYNKYQMHIVCQVMDRSEVSIREKAKELDLKLRFKKRTKWEREEEDKLIRYASFYTAKEIAYLLNRTEASVRSKLYYMKIKAQKSPYFWTDDEVNKLILLSKDYDKNDIMTKMNKSYEAITAKAYELGITIKNEHNRPWTQKESDELLELLPSYSTFEVAQILNRSEEAVIVKAIKLGYEINNMHRKWSSEDEELLSELWGNKSIDYIAKKLNRTVSAISNRVHVLGLGPQINNNYNGLPISEIADLFKINRIVILTSWVALGLKLKYRQRSNVNVYTYVDIKDLYEFLEKNQSIWDSRLLDENILGEEPNWLKEKRRRDIKSDSSFTIDNLNKQQLLQLKKYYLDKSQEQSNTLIKKKQ